MLTREQAIALAESGWWKTKTAREIVVFQLFEPKLCMDFRVYQRSLEEVLDRPVMTHEFINIERLRKEFLGEAKAPTLEEILDMIPEAKRIVVRI